VHVAACFCRRLLKRSPPLCSFLHRLLAGMVRAKGEQRELMNSESVRYQCVVDALLELTSVGTGPELATAYAPEVGGVSCNLCRHQSCASGTLAFETAPRTCPMCLTAGHKLCKVQALELFEGGYLSYDIHRVSRVCILD
jgi:hypothetical protein